MGLPMDAPGTMFDAFVTAKPQVLVRGFKVVNAVNLGVTRERHGRQAPRGSWATWEGR
jgi:hypothetical protein